MEENSNIQPVTISVKKHVVVFGKHDYIVSNVQDLLHRAEFTSAGFTFLPEVMDYVKGNPLDAIIIGGGVDPHDRIKIQNLIKAECAHVKVIEHYGGPATILPELKSVLA